MSLVTSVVRFIVRASATVWAIDGFLWMFIHLGGPQMISRFIMWEIGL